jgi:chromate transporter
VPVSRGVGLLALAAFFLLLGGLPILWTLSHSQGVALFNAFYRSGALVFGGGHVVLPLLREATVTPGWVSDDVFLAGYGAAQAVPGPLFTFAAYLGAVMKPSPNGVIGAIITLIAIFLPGLLVLMGTLPFWETFRRRARAQAIMRGVNAAVVGLLGAALLQSGLDEFGQGSGRLRDCTCRLRATNRMANASARRRRHQRAWRNSSCTRHIVTYLAG